MATHRLGLLLLSAFAMSCTWVHLTPDGETVRLGLADQVTSCERLGNVTTKVVDRLGVFARSDAKVRGELATMARNEAVPMAGDTVVAESAVREGRQTFGVFRCAKGAALSP